MEGGLSSDRICRGLVRIELRVFLFFGGLRVLDFFLEVLVGVRYVFSSIIGFSGVLSVFFVVVF